MGAKQLTESSLGSELLPIELAWAAGFFDGEGCTSLSNGYPIISISQTSIAVLSKFDTATGMLGAINGPYTPKNFNHSKFWTYQVFGFEKVQAIIAMLWANLSDVKKEQAKKSLLSFRDRTQQKTKRALEEYPHGTEGRYNRGCKCSFCQTGHYQYNRRYR